MAMAAFPISPVHNPILDSHQDVKMLQSLELQVLQRFFMI